MHVEVLHKSEGHCRVRGVDTIRPSYPVVLPSVFHIVGSYSIAMVLRRPERFLVYSRCEKLGCFGDLHMAGTRCSRYGVLRTRSRKECTVAFEAQSLTVMQILDEHMALGLEIPEQGAPLNNEPHSTQVLCEHTLIQGMAVPVRNTTSLTRSPRAGAESGFCALPTPNRHSYLYFASRPFEA